MTCFVLIRFCAKLKRLFYRSDLGRLFMANVMANGFNLTYFIFIKTRKRTFGIQSGLNMTITWCGFVFLRHCICWFVMFRHYILIKCIDRLFNLLMHFTDVAACMWCDVMYALDVVMWLLTPRPCSGTNVIRLGFHCVECWYL